MSKKKAPKYTPVNDTNIKADLEKAVSENTAAYTAMEIICAEYNNALTDGETLITDVKRR